MGRSAGRRKISLPGKRLGGLLRTCWSLLEWLSVGMSAHVRLCEKLLGMWGSEARKHKSGSLS
jgi:hypothetical protein